MPSPLIDVHVHLAESAAVGAWSKAAYDIWEYGDHRGVRISSASGDLEDLRSAIRSAGLRRVVVANAFSVTEWHERRLAGLTSAGDGGLGGDLVTYNEWLVDLTSQHRDIVPFVAIDPWVLSNRDLVAHLRSMHARGARGIKIHPVEQRFLPSDDRMTDVYRACIELDMTVLAHSGPTRVGIQFGEPRAFAPVLAAFPELRLVLAHLGGAAWRQCAGIAATYPEVLFDLSEIVAWVGAPRAPSATQLVDLVREIGVERVMFGSDFPWYDPGEMIEAVRALPSLTAAEAAAVVGENAERWLELGAE
jgi:uncharacterized protein